jgi:hypothetical protein
MTLIKAKITVILTMTVAIKIPVIKVNKVYSQLEIFIN